MDLKQNFFGRQVKGTILNLSYSLIFCGTPPSCLKVIGWVVGWYKILVSAPVPLELILTGFDWVGAGPWGFGDLGRGLTKT